MQNSHLNDEINFFELKSLHYFEVVFRKFKMIHIIYAVYNRLHFIPTKNKIATILFE